jgi:hypothetical protein
VPTKPSIFELRIHVIWDVFDAGARPHFERLDNGLAAVRIAETDFDDAVTRLDVVEDLINGLEASSGRGGDVEVLRHFLAVDLDGQSLRERIVHR